MKYSEIIFSEIDMILENMEEKYTNEIPNRLKKFIKENKKKDYITSINFSKPLEEQELQKETKILLAILYINYWCEDEQEKDLLLKRFAENEKIKEKEAREKYNPDNIFNNKYSKDKKISEENMMVEYKQDNLLQKLWNKIKNLFKKNK